MLKRLERIQEVEMQKPEKSVGCTWLFADGVRQLTLIRRISDERASRDDLVIREGDG